jgi:hypothetical protein
VGTDFSDEWADCSGVSVAAKVSTAGLKTGS